jgi:hypothetical protein
MGGGFRIIDFAAAADNVVYIEYPTGSLYLEKKGEVDWYTVMFDHLRATALPIDASRTLITQVYDECR